MNLLKGAETSRMVFYKIWYTVQMLTMHHQETHRRIVQIFAVSSFLFALVWYFTQIHALWLIAIDQWFNTLMPLIQTPPATFFFMFVSDIFAPTTFIMWFIPLLLLLIYKGKWWRAGFLFFGVGGGQVVKTIVKYISNKPRPENPFGIVDLEKSFPSGHTVASVFIFLEVYFFVVPLLKPSWQKPTKALLLAGAFVVPFSRVYLQMHYLSDVVAGALLAIASLTFTMIFFHHFIPWKYTFFGHRRHI